VTEGHGTSLGETDRAIELNAPVRSLKMLELQIAAGATEVYMALLPSPGVPVSFDSLPALRGGEPTHVSNIALLTELIRSAHAAGLRAHLSVDTPIVPTSYEREYLDHAARGLEAGADTLVVGSLAACDQVAERFPDTLLVVGGILGVSTVSYAEYLRDTYGVLRLVLPHTLTLDEIAAFADLPGLEIEVPVQTGSGLDCTRCRLQDTPGIGQACRAGYTAGIEDLGGFLDGASDCALCDVPALADLGVAALQIPGRESPNLRQNAKITQLYRRVLDGNAAQKPMPQIIESIDRVELMWQMGWVPRLCDQQRCRLRDTPQQRAYV
jgi:collagenase-like PrtC family protease